MSTCNLRQSDFVVIEPSMLSVAEPGESGAEEHGPERTPGPRAAVPAAAPRPAGLRLLQAEVRLRVFREHRVQLALVAVLLLRSRLCLLAVFLHLRVRSVITHRSRQISKIVLG